MQQGPPNKGRAFTFNKTKNSPFAHFQGTNVGLHCVFPSSGKCVRANVKYKNSLVELSL